MTRCPFEEPSNSKSLGSTSRLVRTSTIVNWVRGQIKAVSASRHIHVQCEQGLTHRKVTSSFTPNAMSVNHATSLHSESMCRRELTLQLVSGRQRQGLSKCLHTESVKRRVAFVGLLSEKGLVTTCSELNIY